MNDARSGLGRSVLVRLASHAKTIDADPGLVLTRYAIERFLYRLSRSRYGEQFVLKGALLLLVWLGESLRPTRDADLLGFGDLNDEKLVQIIKEVCVLDVEPDAVTFSADSAHIEPIRMDDAYGGRRITLRARCDTADLRVQIDIGIGDAVTPGPQWLDYPCLLDLPRPRLRAYPRETVIAEKLHAMVLLGMRNSRMKDYFDVHALLREGSFDPRTLAEAIAATFSRRQTALPDAIPPGLSDAFAIDPEKRAQWSAFLERNRIEALPLDEVIHDLRRGLVPPLAIARKLKDGS